MIDKAENSSLEFINALNKRLSVLNTQAEKINFVDVYAKLEGKNILEKVLNNINELEKIEFLNNDGKIVLLESRVTKMADSGRDYTQSSIKTLIEKKVAATLEENGNFIVSIPVKIENDVAGYLVFYYSNSTLLAQQNKSIELNIIFLIIFLIICILISILISSKIAKPIFELKKSAEKLEKGNLGVHVDTYTNDEVGELADTFNHMSDNLKKFDQMHVESEKVILVKNRALRMLSNVNQSLIHTVDELSLLDEVCNIVVKDGKYRMVWVGFAEDDEAKTIRPVSHAGFEAGYIDFLNLTWEDSEHGRGPSGTALRTGKLSIASDIATNPNMVPWREEALKRGYKSSIALPLVSDGKAIGVISIYSNELNAFNDEEVKILEEMSKDLAFGITVERVKVGHKLLEEKISRLAEIVQSSDDAIIGKTLDGTITSWNKGAQKIYGYDESEMVGKSISILAPENLKDDIYKLLEKIKEGKNVEHYETVRHKKDGTEIQMSLTISPIFDEKGNVIAASTIGRDITERKKREELIRVSSAYNRRLIEVSLDPLVTIGKDGKITDVNEATEVVTGFSREELIGDNFSNYFTESEKAEEGYKKVLQDGFVKDYPLTIRHTSGRTTDVLYNATVFKNESGEIEGVFAAARDVTERKRVEKEREQFLKFFQISTDIMVIADPNGCFKKVNPTCLKILGYSEEELISKSFIDFVYPDDKQQTLDEMAKQIKSGSSLNFENRYVCKDGKILWLAWRATYDKNENTTYATARDITDIKLAQEEIIRKNRNLRMLSDVNQALIHSTDESTLLNTICSIVNSFGGYRMLWIGFKENDKAKSVRPVVFEGFESGFLETIHPSWSNTESGNIPISIAIRTGKTYIAQDISSANLNADWCIMALKRGYKSVISLPLSDSSQTFGGFTIFSENINAFSGDEVKILEELANDLAFGITSLRINVQSKLLEEELLKASTDRYKALFVSSRDAVMTLEAPSWNFTSGNPTAIKMFGAKNEGDFLYHEPWSLSPKLQPDGQNSMEKAKEMIEKAMKEGSNFFEWTHKRINGEEFPAEVLLSKVEQDGKTFLHALVRDISERKKLDAKLKEYAEERFKAIFDNTNDGIILADLETKKFILSNTAFCQMLGYSADEILKLSVLDIHPQEDLPNVLEQFEKQAKKELKVARDLRVKRKDGTVFYCDINSSPITMNGKKYLIGIFRDTTERRRSEEALRTSEEQFRNIFENGQYGIVLTGSDSRFFKVNPAFCKMLGFTEAELLTKKFSDITHPDNVKADMESVPKMISGEMSNYQTEKRYIKKNGQEIWVNLIISAVRNLDGSFGYFLGMVEDISERKKLDEAKSGFLAITSHQLRTPLTATKWVLEVMMDDKDLTENQKEKINDLTSSNNRLIGLVERLLNVTRIESGKMVVKKELTNLKKLIVDLVSDVEELSQEKKKNIKIVAPENLKDIYLDPVLIREALENLLVNAIDYSEEGSNEISVTVKDRIGDCVVSVHSFGFIEESLATKINKFDKFVRGSDASNKKPSGSGLGLFITKKVIEANGGAFWFESDAKHGTTFHFSVVKDNLI